MATNRATAAPRSYENFDPESELLQGEESDTLAINLPGFKKEELKAALTNLQNLKISGARNLGDNKWSHFEKNVSIPNIADLDRLKAKFDDGVLYIIMPHKVDPAQPRFQTKPTPPPPPPLPQAQSEEKKPATEPKPQVPPKPAPESPPSQKPETSLQKPEPETDLPKTPRSKPVYKPEVQPELSKKPVSLPETPVQPKPTQVDQQMNEKVDEPTEAEKAALEKEGEVDQGYAGESEAAKAKEGGDADDGGARVREMSFGGCATAATFASDLTMGLHKPKQLIINMVVGVLVVLGLLIYVRHIIQRSYAGVTDE